jgi:two-component system, NtrC family, response regulator AlgB
VREHSDGSVVEKCHVAERDASGAALLLVIDDHSTRSSLRGCLEGSFARVLGVSTPSGALEAIARARFDVVLVDLWLGPTSGLALLPMLSRPGTAVIVLAAQASYESAVAAMKLGAADYVPKPFSAEQVRAAVRSAMDTARGHDAPPSALPADAEVFFGGTNPGFQAFLANSQRAAATDCVVLLRGESGTGKNVLARWMHERSLRRAGPFVSVNCPALSGELMSSMLFGHRRGAFTGAVTDAPGKVDQASGGTLFLDEIGDLGLDAQARLLRFLHDRTYERVGDSREERADVRLITATNRDLEARVQAGTFREDLLYRLDVITLALPSLRERPDDLRALAEHFLRTAAARAGRYGASFSPSAVTSILAHRWPGNLRELRHAVERAVILAPSILIEANDLGLSSVPSRGAAPVLGGDVALDEIEREHIARVLARAASLEAAARSLGIDTTTLQRKRRRYGLA